MPFSTGNTLRYPLRTYQECDLGTALQQHAAVITSERSRADNQKPHDSLLVSDLSRSYCEGRSAATAAARLRCKVARLLDGDN